MACLANCRTGLAGVIHYCWSAEWDRVSTDRHPFSTAWSKVIQMHTANNKNTRCLGSQCMSQNIYFCCLWLAPCLGSLNHLYFGVCGRRPVYLWLWIIQQDELSSNPWLLSKACQSPVYASAYTGNYKQACTRYRLGAHFCVQSTPTYCVIPVF